MNLRSELAQVQQHMVQNQTATMLELGTSLLNQTTAQTRKLTDVEAQVRRASRWRGGRGREDRGQPSCLTARVLLPGPLSLGKVWASPGPVMPWGPSPMTLSPNTPATRPRALGTDSGFGPAASLTPGLRWAPA